MLVKKRPWTGRALVFTALSFVMLISITLVNFATISPVTLLHIGPLTEQIEEQALNDVGSGSDGPAPEQMVTDDSAKVARLLSRHPRELQDSKAEQKAEIGANHILGSYDSIMSLPQEAQDFHSTQSQPISVPLSSITAAPQTLHQSKTNTLPNFVLRAQEEMARADYIRNHEVPAPSQYPSQQKAGTRFSHPSKRQSSVIGSRHNRQIITQTKQNRPAKKASKSSIESTIQSLVKKAVQSAMGRIEKGNKADKVSPSDMRRLGNYISQAEAARIKLASPSTVAAVPVSTLRTKQEKVLAKRVAQAQALLSKMVHNDAQRAGSPSVEAIPDSDATPSTAFEDPASRSLAREGLMPAISNEKSLTMPATIRSIREGQSEFSQEERHLETQIDTIFGSSSHSENQKDKTHLSTLRERSPSDRPAARIRTRREHESESSAETSESEEMVRQKSEELEILKLENQVKHMQEKKRLEELKRQLRQMRERLKVRELKKQVLKEQQLVQLRRRQQALEEAEAADNEKPGEEDEEAKPEDEEDEEEVRVCDPLGCRMVPVSPTLEEHKAPRFTPPSNRSDVRAWVDQTLDGADIWNAVLPWGSWKESWEPEVGLDENGTIVASHDDPNGHLTPHNSFQEEAVYPDGPHREAPSPGISNMLGEHLFDDNIVVAAPGFNAGTGRHVRTQQAVDWQRNWGSHIVKGDKVLVH